MENLMDEVLEELARATRKYPTWPTDPLHALAVLGEEFGELTKAVLQHTYEPDKASLADVREEAVQTAAMALRFLLSLERYEYKESVQHHQDAPAHRAEAPDYSARAAYNARMLVMATTLQLLDAAQRAVRTTTAPALAVSLAEIHYPGETGYCPGVMFTRLDDQGVGDAVTVEVGTRSGEAGRVRPAYRLRGLGVSDSVDTTADTQEDVIAAALAVFSNQAARARA